MSDPGSRKFTFADAGRKYEQLLNDDWLEQIMMYTALMAAACSALLPSLWYYMQKRKVTQSQIAKQKAAKQALQRQQAQVQQMHASTAQEKQRAQQETQRVRQAKEQANKQRMLDEITASKQAQQKQQAKVASKQQQQLLTPRGGNGKGKQSRHSPNSSTSNSLSVPADLADNVPTDANGPIPDLDDDESRSAAPSRTAAHCAICKKHFKSVEQLSQHQQSKQHQKAVKEQNRQ